MLLLKLFLSALYVMVSSYCVCCCQVPGLFEGDEYTTLMTQCKEGSQRDGLMLDSSEELYKWFTQQVGVSFILSAWFGGWCMHCFARSLYLRFLFISNRL